MYGDKPVAGTGILHRDETILFEGSLISGNAELIDSVENYDELLVIANHYKATICHNVSTILPTEIIYGLTYQFSWVTAGNGDAVSKNTIYYSFSNDTTIVIDTNYNNSFQIMKVIGVKYNKAKQSYSTEEQIVGTWIDGKPLYQKTITGTMPSTTGTFTKHYIDVENMEMAYVYDGYCKYSDSAYAPMGYTNYYSFDVSITDSCVTINNSQSQYLSKPFVCTIRYTKTTDAATITE